MIQTDITDSYRQEQERLQTIQNALLAAEKANSAKTDFVSRISHDIRTPISAITSMTTFAQEDIGDEKKLREDLGKIEAANTFLLSLINDILDISKIDSGKIELFPEPYLFDESKSKLASMFEPLCTQKGLRFTLNASHGTERGIIVDKVRFDQITMNLLSNAVKYTPSGGSVTCSSACQPLGGGLVDYTFTVCDTGIGMSEQFQRTMFEPFTQEASEYRKNNSSSGSGLGLAIVNRLVHLMSGTITVKSRIGEGTCVTVTLILPAADPGAAVPQAAAPAAEPAHPLCGTILLADDNAINTEIAIRILERMGAAVHHASNGAQCVEMFKAAAPGTYQAILMDIQMPVMNGFEAAEKIRALEQADAGQIPIIAMTADAFEESIRAAKEAGMDDYITKPIDPALLSQRLTCAITRVEAASHRQV